MRSLQKRRQLYRERERVFFNFRNIFSLKHTLSKKYKTHSTQRKKKEEESLDLNLLSSKECPWC